MGPCHTSHSWTEGLWVNTEASNEKCDARVRFIHERRAFHWQNSFHSQLTIRENDVHTNEEGEILDYVPEKLDKFDKRCWDFKGSSQLNSALGFTLGAMLKWRMRRWPRRDTHLVTLQTKMVESYLFTLQVSDFQTATGPNGYLRDYWWDLWRFSRIFPPRFSHITMRPTLSNRCQVATRIMR